MADQLVAPSRDPLIGRSGELAELGRLLSTFRLVSITGLGGTGKTRLARAFVEIAPGDTPATFIDLSSLARAADVGPAIAEAVGIVDAGGEDLQATLLTAFAAAPSTLLVLDNFEHVLEAGSLVTDLLRGAPGLRVLATSRIRLGAPDEAVLALGPLASPATVGELDSADASRLFLRRAAERGALVVMDGSEAAAVVEICRRLDGLPLALELAAAWTRILTPRAIVKRLEAGHLQLGPGELARQETLERVVESTLELLRPDDRVAFDRLSVFVAGFDEVGAAAITILDDVLPTLRRLEDVALIRAIPQSDGEPRFGTLETIRAIGAARLATRADQVEVRRRFVESCAERAQLAADELRDLHPAAALAWMTAEAANLRAALDAAVTARDAPLAVQLAMTLATYGVRAGSARESLRRLRTAMAIGPVPAGIHSEALTAILNLSVMLNEPGDVLALGREALALAREGGDERREVRALIGIGSNEAAWRDAITALSGAAELSTRIGYDWGILVATDNLASVHATEGHWKEALELFRRSLHIAGGDGNVGYILVNIAELNAFLGHPEHGLPFAERAIVAIGKSWPTSHLMAWALAVQATCETLVGRGSDGCRSLAEACAVAKASESDLAARDVLDASVTVLARIHPEAAARAAAAVARMERDDPQRAIRGPVRPASEASVRRGLGPKRFEAEWVVGAEADPWHLLADIAGLADAAHLAGSRLRADYGTLTPREIAVLRLLAVGRSDQEIASELAMSPKTASVHVSNIKAKLGAETRIEAALRAQALVATTGR